MEAEIHLLKLSRVRTNVKTEHSLSIKRHRPFNHMMTLSYKTLDFYLILSLLLESVEHSQSSVQHCLLRNDAGQLPNFTSEAGLPFYYKLPIPATSGPTQHYQLSLVNGDSTLPSWMEFSPETCSLSGLALAEDCGIYHLEVSVNGDECAAYFYFHILNITWVHDGLTRDVMSCSEGKSSVWVSLLLKLNPATLKATKRVRLTNNMADYLHLPQGFVYLLLRQTFSDQQKKLRHTPGWKSTSDNKVNASGDVAELLWPLSCREEEQLTDFAKKLENDVSGGELAMLLGGQVLGWMLLCAPDIPRYKAKRCSRRLRATSTPLRIAPTQSQVHLHVLSVGFANLEPSFATNFNHLKKRHEQMHAKYSNKKTVKDLFQPFGGQTGTFLKKAKNAFQLSSDKLHFNSLTLHSDIHYPQNLQASVITVKGSAVFPLKPLIEATSCCEFNQEIQSAGILEYFSTTDIFPLTCCQTSTARTIPADPAFSQPLHSIYPSLQLTPALNSAITLPTRVTFQLQPKENPLWTGSYTGRVSDSESRSTVSSLGPIIYNKETIKDLDDGRPTLSDLPSVSHQPPTEWYSAVQESNSRLSTKQSLPPSNKTPSTQQGLDASPTSLLMTGHLSKPHSHSETIQHLSLVSKEDVISQLNVTTQDVSSATRMGQLILSGQTELESSLTVSFFEPSLLTVTPALLSEDDYFRTQLETMNVLSSDNLFMSLPSALQMNPPLTITNPVSLNTSSIFKDKPSEEQPLIISDDDFMQLQPSIRQTVPAQLFTETDMFSHISLVTGKSTSASFRAEVLTEVAPSQTETYPAHFSTSESIGLFSIGHFDPSTPPTGQKSYTTIPISLMQTLDPSFPFYGQSVNDGSQETQTGYPEKTPDFLTIYSQDKKHRTEYAALDSSGPYLSTFPYSLPSVLQEQTKSSKLMSLLFSPAFNLYAHPYTNYIGTTSPMHVSDISDSFAPSEPSAFSGNCTSKQNSLLICRSFTTDSSGTVTNGRPTQQIPSTFLRQFDGILTTLLSSSQTADLSLLGGQSSVKPSPPSSSVSTSYVPPKVLQPLPVLVATVGFPFQFLIPIKTFLDQDDSNADTLSLETELIDGPPDSIGTWLMLNGLELHGIPLEVDLQFSPQDFLLVAQDKGGLSVRLPLTVDLQRSIVVPCHVYTLIIQRSLHSILRHRHRVELLLRKLSRFFNSSSDHLVIESVRPGSTVVSWYNHSLCNAGRCDVDQIRSTWMGISSKDGSVNPAFREAMLPEFPISKVGPVSYSQQCIFDGSTPALGTSISQNSTSSTCSLPSPVTSTQTDHYKWMAAMLTALLVVCLLILIVLLVAFVLYFCKSSRRSKLFAIWPAGRVLDSIDRSAVKPRRPPIFQPELPPPPLTLWINFPQDDEGQA